jgi:ribose transport system ATP-binding protein
MSSKEQYTGPMLCVNRVGKRLGGSETLREITFAVKSGEALGIVGENGAGKSTLLALLDGSLKADSGQMLLYGKRYAPRLPQHGLAHGIVLVHQDPPLFENLSIAENLFISGMPRILGCLNGFAMRKRAQGILDQIGLQRPPGTPVYDLSMAERQLVGIGKALARQAKLVLLDEPTSALSGRQASKLLQLIERLKADGIAIILASQHLPDVQMVCDQIMVLRDGSAVASGARNEFSADRMMALMVGRSLTQFFPPRPVQPAKEVVLETRGLGQAPLLDNISFKVHRREVVGLAGLKGSGRTRLARILYGVEPCSRGEILIEGRLRNGTRRVALISANRDDDGLCLEGSVRDNVLLANFARYARSPFGVLDEREIENDLGALRERVGLNAAIKYDDSASGLSDGDQQKLLFARWMARDPAVFILDEPGAGMDTDSKFEIYKLINEVASAGAGVLLISSQIEELVGMCDRVLVMSNGKLTEERARKDFDRENILRAGLRSLLHA